MKVFHKGDHEKASDLLGAFLEKHNSENELVDRVKMYLKICDRHVKKEVESLKSFDDYFQSGTFKANQGEYEEALKMLIKAQSLKPKEGKVFYLISSVYCRLDQPEKCLEYLENAVAFDSRFAILAQNEEDFNSLKEDEKFKLVTRKE
jgi:tetratricopeptide (TPR) repeat protein